MKTIKILHVVTDMRRGGLETMLMNYYRNIDLNQIQFDFLEHRVEKSDYDCEIEKLGGKIYRLPKLNPFSVQYRCALSKFFRKHPEYQIVHVHQDCLSSIILKVAKKYGVKVRIAHSHSNSQDKNWKYLLKLYYKKSIPKYATHLFACSNAAGEWMFSGNKFQILNNAIDATQYIYSNEIRKEVRNELGIEGETLVVGHVGRFSYPKNHMHILEVFKVISDKNNAMLLLVGDGELKASIEQRIIQLELQNKVMMIGIRNDVNRILQAMDVFLFPSFYEGLGIVAIEAQAAGLPCVISDKVPIECKKTDLVKQISLKENINYWAKEVLNSSKIQRRNTLKEICESNFEIKANSKMLVEFYKNCL